MKIRLLSDLHHEFYEDQFLYKTRGEDVLVLAGDINVGVDRTSMSLLRFLQEQRNIVYVPGNHEAYGTTLNDFDSGMRKFCKAYGVQYMNPSSAYFYEHSDGTWSFDPDWGRRVLFIGATLWTDFGDDYFARHAAANQISDFHEIKGFKPFDCIQLNVDHKDYIKDVYNMSREMTDCQKVVVTHFLPTYECISDRYRDGNALNKYFANDLTNYIGQLEDTTWLFGHTHDDVDITIGETRCIANPYGYNVNSTYKEMIIEI
jgi:predicted phosphodiesterase